MLNGKLTDYTLLGIWYINPSAFERDKYEIVIYFV